mgnify:CR=1 FL=1
MLRLTAHFVSAGYTPQQIHAITDQLTLSGYTIEQTRQAVQKMIDGAKNKGFEKTAKTFSTVSDKQDSISIYVSPQLKTWEKPKTTSSKLLLKMLKILGNYPKSNFKLIKLLGIH